MRTAIGRKDSRTAGFNASHRNQGISANAGDQVRIRSQGSAIVAENGWPPGEPAGNRMTRVDRFRHHSLRIFAAIVMDDSTTGSAPSTGVP